MLLLGRPCGWAWATVRAVPLPLHPLRAAMLNVTADYDQVGWGLDGWGGACLGWGWQVQNGIGGQAGPCGSATDGAAMREAAGQ